MGHSETSLPLIILISSQEEEGRTVEDEEEEEEERPREIRGENGREGGSEG